MIRSGCSSVNFCWIASCSLLSLRAATESGFPTRRALSARSLIVRGSTATAVTLFTCCCSPGMWARSWGPVTEAEDVHLVPGREVTDLVEGRDFVSAVWREWDTPTDIKNPH